MNETVERTASEPRETPGERVTVLLADDQDRARRSLRALLGTCPDVEIVAEARDGGEAVRLVGDRSPDVVLMDLKMPSLDGLEATKWIKVRWPETAVLVLTMYPDKAAQAREAGADGFLVKGCTPEQLISRIREVGRRLTGPAKEAGG